MKIKSQINLSQGVWYHLTGSKVNIILVIRMSKFQKYGKNVIPKLNAYPEKKLRKGNVEIELLKI